MTSLKAFLRSPASITLFSLALAYSIAFAIDASLEKLEKYAGATFNFMPAVSLSFVAPVVSVIGILALAWLALRRLPPNQFTASVFIISSLFVIGVYLSFFIGFPFWLRDTIIGRFRSALMNFGFQSSIYFVASACIVIGIAALWRTRVNRNSFQAN